jgi:streptogrisin C
MKRALSSAPSARRRTTVLSALCASMTALTFGASCVAEVDSYEPDLSSDDEEGVEVAPDVAAAMVRDLGMAMEDVVPRLRAESAAVAMERTLRREIGSQYAGAWMNETGNQLVVGITDMAHADAVRTMGAEPRLVKRSLAQLSAFKESLDAITARPDPSVHSWHVDPITNSVVVVAEDPSSSAVTSFVGSLNLADGVARVVATEDERPQPMYDTRGGDEYIINGNVLCSVGFAVNGGFVTAGHCGGVNSTTQGSNRVAQGTFRGSSFPGNDYAWVQTNSSWNTLGEVNNYGGGAVPVAGSQQAAVGSSVCRSGRTTGWRCGTIQAHNVTINYAQGQVFEASQTSACAQGGDSGGSFISGNQAQGVTSGGSGNCTTGGTIFYQPVNEILSVYGLSLKTTGGGGGGPIISNLNNKCIDVPGSNFVDGARLQMYTCNGTGAQRWTYTGGTFQAGGKCMDVAGANPADGTPIQLVSCNGNLAQQFVLNGAGDLVSLLANKCVDIGGWNGNDGAQLIIWPCHGGANQKWRR